MVALAPPSPPIPGPPPVPLLGWRANLIPALRDPVVVLRELYWRYGPIVSLPRGATRFLFAFSPEFNRQILSNTDLFYNGDVDSTPIRLPKDSASARLASGLTTMNGAKHRQQRRLMMPAFHRKRVESYHDEMVALTEARLARWRPGQTRDIQREMKLLTLSIALRTLLGLDPEQAGEALRRRVERWMALSFSAAALAAPLDIPGLPFHQVLRLSEQLEQDFGAIIARKRAAGGGNDVLTMLIEAHDEDGSRMADQELIAQTMTLFVAGHETTANALTWTLFLLTQHPRVAADLLDELDGALRGAAPRVDQIAGLPLLDRVLKESLRLLPPAQVLLRVTQAPCRMGPYDVPAGTSVFFSPPITHRIPEIYPQPERFLPERWERIDPSIYEYLPFGAGPRMCIGAAFATTEMKLVLPMILQRFRLDLPPGARVDRAGAALAAPRGGLPMRLHAQDRRFTKTPAQGSIRDIVDLS
jgi:cytochrome P450